jgi:death-on-curing protein
LAIVGLTPSYIEKIHDELVAIRFPDDEPVGKGRNLGLIASAANRPFQTAGGNEIYPTLIEKAAALFHGINANHIFVNGCKRTSVIAVDLFLSANWRFLAMSGEDLRELATKTADHNRLRITQDRMMIEIKEALEARTIWLPRLFLNGYVQLAWGAYKQGQALRAELNYHNPASVRKGRTDG